MIKGMRPTGTPDQLVDRLSQDQHEKKDRMDALREKIRKQQEEKEGVHLTFSPILDPEWHKMINTISNELEEKQNKKYAGSSAKAASTMWKSPNKYDSVMTNKPQTDLAQTFSSMQDIKLSATKSVKMTDQQSADFF